MPTRKRWRKEALTAAFFEKPGKKKVATKKANERGDGSSGPRRDLKGTGRTLGKGYLKKKMESVL